MILMQANWYLILPNCGPTYFIPVPSFSYQQIVFSKCIFFQLNNWNTYCFHY